MSKKKRVTVAAEGGDGFGTERQVRDKVAVHDVDVQPFQAEFCDGGGAGGKVRVIAGKERRGEKGRVYHVGQRNGPWLVAQEWSASNRLGRGGRASPHVEDGVGDFGGERFGE